MGTHQSLLGLFRERVHKRVKVTSDMNPDLALLGTRLRNLDPSDKAAIFTVWVSFLCFPEGKAGNPFTALETQTANLAEPLANIHRHVRVPKLEAKPGYVIGSACSAGNSSGYPNATDSVQHDRRETAVGVWKSPGQFDRAKVARRKGVFGLRGS